MSGLVATAKTWLFVPGDRPDRFAKAAASGAQIVILDLEDAVAADRKDAARESVIEHLRDAEPGAALVVRANSPFSAEGQADLEALRKHLVPYGPLLAVMTPKATFASVELAAEQLGSEAELVALIESGLGVEQAFALASHPNVVRLTFGALDYAADVGAEPVREALGYAESRIVNASAAAELARPLARPTVELDDLEHLAKESSYARTLGFGGKLCLHPKQITTVAAAFSPTQREVDWAKRVVALSESGAVRVEGEMIDAPQILRAQNILKEAGAS